MDGHASAPGGKRLTRAAARSSRRTGSPYSEVLPAAFAAGVLFGVGALLIAGFFLGLDYSSTKDATTEHAVVVSVGPSGSKETCGVRALSPDTPGERTTYRSADPPPGLPAEFTQTHCPNDGYEPGMVVPVRRTGLGEDDVHVEPIESAGQWWGMSAIVGVATFVIAGAITGSKEAWSAHRSVRRARRRAARGQEALADES